MSMEIEKAFAIIEDHVEEGDFSGPISLKSIEEAERMLRVTFPPSYRKFLVRYGAGDIAGLEFYGIINDPNIDREGIPNGIWLTQNLRKETALPVEFVVVSETGYGPYYVIDTSQKNERDESPIYLWNVGNQKEKVADSFGEFLLSLLQESV